MKTIETLEKLQEIEKTFCALANRIRELEDSLAYYKHRLADEISNNAQERIKNEYFLLSSLQ